MQEPKRYPEGTLLLEDAPGRAGKGETRARRPVVGAPRAEARPEGGGQGVRQHHLDALRSVLMILGVVLHASYLHATGKAWLVRDGDTSRVLLWVNEAIHAFRIPCFFILSGFFARMLLVKQGRKGFLRSRLMRLGLPLLSTAVTLNVLQAWLLHPDMDPIGFLTSGEWVGHLWFLVDALAFSLAAAGLGALGAALAPLARLRPSLCRVRRGSLAADPAAPQGQGLFARVLLQRGGFLLLLPLTAFPALAAAALLPALFRQWGGLSGFGLLHYFPYFAFGFLLYRHQGMRAAFQRFRPWQAMSLAAALGLGSLLDSADAAWARAAVFYLQAYVVWTLCALLFAVFRRLFDRKTRFFAYLSEASYSIYLLHHVAVVALGLAFRRLSFPPYLEFSAIVALSLAFSLGAHHALILRLRPMRLLFMGK